MASYLDNYRSRTQRSGTTTAEKIVTEGRKEYERYLRESPTHHNVQISRPQEATIIPTSDWIDVSINNITMNDKRNLDEKILTVRYDENIDVGCYVRWRNCYWMVVFQEYNSIDTHKTYVVRRCNQTFKYKHEGVLYEIPICATNLTLYSDGLADGKYLSRQDSKRNVWIGDSPISRMILPNTRIMLTHKTVFRATHIDDFSTNGIISLIVLQCAIEPEDDLTNNIAYNGENLANQPIEIPTETVIMGAEYMLLGTEKEYIISNQTAVRWELILNDSVEFAKIVNVADTNCKVKTTTSSKFVGKNIVLNAYDKTTDELLASKQITIRGYF